MAATQVFFKMWMSQRKKFKKSYFRATFERIYNLFIWANEPIPQPKMSNGRQKRGGSSQRWVWRCRNIKLIDTSYSCGDELCGNEQNRSELDTSVSVFRICLFHLVLPFIADFSPTAMQFIHNAILFGALHMFHAQLHQKINRVAVMTLTSRRNASLY